MNNGWDSVHVSSLAVRPGKDRILYAGSYNGGIWKYGFVPSSIARKANLSYSKQFSLFQNYPNPFNLTTTIRYNLSKSGIVKITVYSVSGEEAVVLVNEEKQPGVHTIKFKAAELSSGIYFYRMEVDDVVETKKFLFIK